MLQMNNHRLAGL